MTDERKSIAQLINSQHEQDEETEFYPSTQEIVNKAAEWISEHGSDVYSVLDIGCGNGAFFEKLDKTDFFYNDDYKNKNHFSKFHQAYEKYGIEKSFILAEQLPEDVILLGSDFRTNTLFDEQITEFFFELAKPENIHRYKSNKRWNDSDWKYLKEQCFEYGRFRTDKAIKTLKNIMLDYRVIITDWHNFDMDWSKCRFSGSCLDFLYDMSVIAENLGFALDLVIPGKYDDVEISEWSNRDIFTKDGKLFCNLKLYKNGNRHIKFCKEFMQKLNVEMARINGWIHDKTEAAEEFGMSEAEVSKCWTSNLKIGITEGRTLLGLPESIGA